MYVCICNAVTDKIEGATVTRLPARRRAILGVDRTNTRRQAGRANDHAIIDGDRA